MEPHRCEYIGPTRGTHRDHVERHRATAPGHRPRRRAAGDGRARRRAAELHRARSDTGLAKSTTSRLLTALERTELLERDDGGALRRRPAVRALRHPARPVGRAGPARPARPASGSATPPARPSTSPSPAATASSRSPRSTRRTCSAPRDWIEVDVPAALLGARQGASTPTAPCRRRPARWSSSHPTHHHRARRRCAARARAPRAQRLRQHRRRARDRARRRRRPVYGARRRRRRRARHLGPERHGSRHRLDELGRAARRAQPSSSPGCSVARTRKEGAA